MFNYESFFLSHIKHIKSENRYREFVKLQRIAGRFPYAINSDNNKEVVLWCINDYLGLGEKEHIKEAAIKAIEKFGVGSGGTRNIGGNTALINELEKEVASLHNKENSLVFTSGYVANDTTLATLSKIIPGIVFFSDEKNHSSLITGIKNSGAEKHIFRHNDMNHLKELMALSGKDKPKMIVFESIYSMDGSRAPIKEICDIAEEFNSMTYIDEVHSVGLYGKGGAGVAEEVGVADKIDIIQGTFGKAYGVIGGYIAASNILIDCIRSTAPGFIFTTSLPPMVCAAAISAVRHLKKSDLERTLHKQQVDYLKKSLKDSNIDFLKNDTHIVPIVIGDPLLTKIASQKLLNDHSIFVQYINYPTVEKGTERLRFTPTPAHTQAMIDELVQSLQEVLSAIKKEEQAA